MEIQINLQISPAVKDPLKDPDGWPINNADIRFLERIEVAKLPNVGDAIELNVQPGIVFQASVTRSDWHEEKKLFVVACRYTPRSIPRVEYVALMSDPE